MKKMYVLNTLLAAVVGVALAVIVLMRTFLPQYIMPQAGIPGLVLISLAALVPDHYIANGAKRCYICIPVLAFATFALLPLACGFAPVNEILRLALLGSVTFTVTTWLFSSVQDRLSSGPAAKFAPVISAFGLWLAAQCLSSII